MQFKLAFVTAALAGLAAATPAPRGGGPTCSTGSLTCCNSLESASNPVVGLLAGLLGIVLGDLTAQVGLTCSPITVVGVGSNGCQAQTVCCEDNSSSKIFTTSPSFYLALAHWFIVSTGVISIGCLPIQL
ncbi:hypothetical protein GYMLUDRAFT_167808 [Collybiopsis luxurians FD-317 M1]|uniref:Hydrophobin n=1 Tax=Collybiopsis luxurians FD-317 M1 TaxID=944289 RepID=A0A0D0BXW3_9AGAR|nr:hypothetical protein GYMLUDRAFT_167808 [Collybiopsis luxurians FD-317 M1]